MKRTNRHSYGRVLAAVLALLFSSAAAVPLGAQERAAAGERAQATSAAAAAEVTLDRAEARPGDRASRSTGQEGLPPLIDRQIFFGDPTYSGAQISPDGRWISFLKPYRDVRNIWVKRVGQPFDEAKPVTADTTRPVPGYFWTQDSERILYVQDKGGNENFHIYAVDPDAEPREETGVPPARDVTPYGSVQARIYGVPEATPGEIIVGINDRNQQVHDVYRLDLETGERELIAKNTEGIAGWVTDLEGRVRLAVRQTDTGGTEVLEVGGTSEKPEFREVYECDWRESCNPVRFHEDGDRVYLSTNKGEGVDLQRLVLFDPETGETEFVEEDPEGEVDFAGAQFSDRTDELVATYYVGERRRIYPKTESFREDLEFLREELPDGEISFGSSTEDESLQIVRVSRDVDPGSTYLFDREDRSLELLYRSRPELPSEHLAHMEAIRYQARDGLSIPAYLTLPRGVDHQDLPLVVMPHGGPWARDTWGYDSYAQFFANRGYAVLQPNFRGSTGYGKEFLNAGNDEWGDAMQDDITDGVEHLVEEGVVDPDRVGIFGGSYGGYATLAGVTFTPEVYAAGASYVGPSSILTLLESIPPYWKPIQQLFHVRVGDPGDPEDRERLKRQSPLYSADRIDDPLLVIQGANDPRVNKRESDQIVVAARENGVDVEYLVAEDEGHGFRNEDNRLAVAAALEEFFAKHLGGRYQEDAADPIAKRLNALRVKVDTLTLPDTAAAQAAIEEASRAGLPSADGTLLSPARLGYAATVEARGQKVELTSTRVLTRSTRDGRPVWRLVEDSETPRGTVTDTTELDRRTLMPVRRSVGGVMSMTLTYMPDSIAGEIGAMGRTFDVGKALEEPVMASDAGMDVTLAALPLEEGYSATLRAFAPQQQQVRVMELEVTGTQEVTVPAGTFRTLVVETSTVSGPGAEATYYVMADAPHHVVKAESSLAGMGGGGTVTQVLTSVEDASGG